MSTSEVKWGVDSVSPMNQANLDALRATYGGDPDLWGRYLHDEGSSQRYGLKVEELLFARQHNIPILVIDYNPGTDQLFGYKSGRLFAERVVGHAQDLGIPTSVAIFADIEDQVDSAWIHGWYEGLTGPDTSGGYQVGFYADPGKEPFKSAYCDAIAANPRIGAVSVLWSFRPQVGRTKKAEAPPYRPNTPSCGPAGTVLAYQYGQPGNPSNINPFPNEKRFDTDLFLPELTRFLFHP